MNSLFSYLFTEFERDILGGVRDYFGEVSGGKIDENYQEKMRKKIRRIFESSHDLPLIQMQTRMMMQFY